MKTKMFRVFFVASLYLVLYSILMDGWSNILVEIMLTIFNLINHFKKYYDHQFTLIN